MSEVKVTSVVPVDGSVEDASEDAPKAPTDNPPGSEVWASKKLTETTMKMPRCCRRGPQKKVLISLAMKRATRFGATSALVLLGGFVWSGVRFYLMVDGENQVSEQNFKKLAASIGKTIRQRVEKDLVYQDMIANVWAATPNITRAHFRTLVMSEAYAPGLETMTGISLIPRVLGAAQRRALEDHPDSEHLRTECCANTGSTGSSCATVAATGLFCRSNDEQRYQITQFGANGLEPAIANTSDYIARVGSEEYMVVDMIEPFASNSKVWGFNLLSSQTRNLAWQAAQATGQKTFTRRLNLVQSSSSEYGFLVWLPIFSRADGSWTTALSGNVTGLTSVGSVNGVYRAQHLLTTAMESTYSEEQLQDITVYLFDAATELNGQSQYLGVHGSSEADPYNTFAGATESSVSQNEYLVERVPIKVASADAEWVVLVAASNAFLSDRRTNNPWLALVISLAMLIGGAVERWLGHPALVLESLSAYHIM